jgi:hypothetical protein
MVTDVYWPTELASAAEAQAQAQPQAQAQAQAQAQGPPITGNVHRFSMSVDGACSYYVRWQLTRAVGCHCPTARPAMSAARTGTCPNAASSTASPTMTSEIEAGLTKCQECSRAQTVFCAAQQP